MSLSAEIGFLHMGVLGLQRIPPKTLATSCGGLTLPRHSGLVRDFEPNKDAVA